LMNFSYFMNYVRWEIFILISFYQNFRDRLAFSERSITCVRIIFHSIQSVQFSSIQFPSIQFVSIRCCRISTNLIPVTCLSSEFTQIHCSSLFIFSSEFTWIMCNDTV
jgi:hypothetical protein